MREKFTVTITDFRGSRHFSLHQVARTFAIGLVVTVVATVLVGGSAIWWLNKEVSELETRRDEALSQYSQLLQVNGSLLQTVDQKNNELDYLTNELTEIEALIGLRDESDETPERSINQRLDSAGHTALERTTFLQNVPSGYPLQNRGVTSTYGWRTHPVQNTRRFHTGIDMRATVGTPVVAPADGVVEYAGFHRQSGFGNLIILNHNFGFRTYFAHLDGFSVKPGEFVRKGSVIGTSGETGVTDGPHLHYEIWHIQRRLDPKPFLGWSLANYDGLFEEETSVKWESLAHAVRLRLNAPLVHRLTIRDTANR
ncbi:MAG: M23 family metallopeptidase [Aquisalimonadaceae bacterium]